jgi:GH24 family phage-related lysozyme (muramidase)
MPQNVPLVSLFDFKESEIKFQLSTLMNTLRDSRHEGWVLAAYPDPKTSRPLIGAGFGLDVMATEHIQRDPLNPHPFLEPSTAQLWQAAGLDSEKLQTILDQYDRELKAWRKKNLRKKIRTHALSPELTEEEATRLLRISVIQATYNARAYCREFDQLTAPQQMALSQLVFQMGTNLEEFTQFLSAINDATSDPDSAQPVSNAEAEAERWKAVQTTLIQSQWARRYSSRAVAVIAMFDPNYDNDPRAAERKVQATLRPPAHHRKKGNVAHA